MQLSNAPGKLVLPFANAGAKNTIPAASQIGITAGAASLTDGFPPLTRTPIAAGGVPPSGLDMNGILYALSAALRWANAGGGYVYDGTFATDSNVGGYPKGARVLRSDGAGYWLNTIDGNTVDPETSGAAAAGWVPDLTNGLAAVTMTSANVTLTPMQYGKPIVVLSGTLTANLNLIFPNLAGEWAIINNCTGAFSVTAKTADGSGLAIPAGGNALIYGDGTNIASLVASKGVQRFTANGSFVVPANVTTIYVTGCGGGGGGGGSVTAAAGQSTGGGGGGGGGQSIVRQAFSVTPGQSISITIGGAGSAGTVGGAGNNGGSTVIGSLITLAGGSGGAVGGGSSSINSAGGAGGAGSPRGTSGGDSGSTLGAGSFGGAGASGPFGGGGGGVKGNGGASSGGMTGFGFGSGGGGAGGVNGNASGSGATGGTGTQGIAIIEW